MSPLQLASFYAKSAIDFKGDQVLEVISKLGPKTLVGEIVGTCNKNNIASPATTHKKLTELEARGFVTSRVPSSDYRCREVSITKRGTERLQNWGKM
jgi:DNA-binding MarR family transcriptional regulator